MTQERKQTDRRWLWIAIAALLVVVFFSVRFMTRDRLTVRVAEASRSALVSTISTNGRVEPEDNYQLYAPVSATVKAVYVQQGDHVSAGQLLMALDDVEAKARVATAESGVRAAQAAVEAATHNGTLQERQQSSADIERARIDRDEAARNFNTINRLQASGSASMGEVLAAKQRLQSADSQLHSLEQSSHNRFSPAEIARAQAQLHDAEANLAAAREVLNRTQLRAPVSGTVYTIDVQRSEMAEEGHELISLADLHHVRVRAYFDEPEIGKLAVGQAVQVTWDARQGRTWNGHIDRVPASVTTYGTRNVGEVLIKLDDSDGTLLPQTNVTVRATLSTQADALNIPREALRSEAGKPYVFKVEGEELRKVPVTPGTINLTQAAILSGLNQGDRVATSTVNGQPLQEGLPIKVAR